MSDPMNPIPTRGSKAVVEKAEKIEKVVAPEKVAATETLDVSEKVLAAAKPATFAAPTAFEKKKFNLAGRYRVREGYHVAHGMRADSEGHIGHHGRAAPGEIIELSHEDALVVIRATQHAKDPVTGRTSGPAIETEEIYNARVESERANAEFMRQLVDANPLM